MIEQEKFLQDPTGQFLPARVVDTYREVADGKTGATKLIPEVIFSRQTPTEAPTYFLDGREVKLEDAEKATELGLDVEVRYPPGSLVGWTETTKADFLKAHGL